MNPAVRVPTRVTEAQKAKNAADAASREEETMKKSNATATVKQGVRIALITPTHLRTLLKRGKIVGTKQADGNWAISVTSLRKYAKEAQARLDKRQASLRNGTYGQNVRPTVATAQRMRKFVKADSILSDTDKKTFLEAIDRYEAQKNAEYEKRTATADGK